VTKEDVSLLLLFASLCIPFQPMYLSDGSKGQSGHDPLSILAIDFGPSNEEIYVRYWETY